MGKGPISGRLRPGRNTHLGWREAEVLFRRIGITFAVYGEADAQERLIPFDVLPRILSAPDGAQVPAFAHVLGGG